MEPKIYFAGVALRGCTGRAAGRALLQQLYQTHVGGPLPDIRIADGGKPFFADSEWHFSISHTDKHAFCVLADRPVGLDAEEADRMIDLRLAKSILSQMELAQFAQAEDPRKALLTFWVLKEAEGKLTGRGIGFHPRHTAFCLTDDRVQETNGCIVAIVY